MFDERILRRFWAKVQKGETCWTWQACISPYGYGGVGIRGHRYQAHRVSWMIANGDIPDGMSVLHRCDNRRCVNPAHLFLGTKQDNNLDRDMKGRTTKGEMCPTARLTKDQVRAIRELLDRDDANIVHIARRFGIARSSVWRIREGITWKSVPRQEIDTAPNERT